MIKTWHNWLDLPRFNKAWYEADLKDELAELEEETKLLKIWSELSDVSYTVSRSVWSDNEVKNPLSRRQYIMGTIYMIPKYSLRYLFYRSAGRKAGADKDIKWIRNPNKLHKLRKVVDEQDISVDIDKLISICKKQRKYWLLLP